MGLISKLKQSLGVDKLDTQEAKEILKDLKAEIEAEEKATAQSCSFLLCFYFSFQIF